MIADTRELAGEPLVRCDVCIVGAGPAGITLALELAKDGTDVVLLESGGIKFDPDAHDLARGTSDDLQAHGALDDYRRRRLGGSATAWGGRCVPFDPIDFEQRDFVPHSGWPFGREVLDPYFERAHPYLDLGAFEYSAKKALREPAKHLPFIPGLRTSELTADPIYRFSPPTNFGKKYEQPITRSGAIRLFLFATVKKLVTNEERKAVTRLEAVSTTGGKKLTVIARRYVLAGGGLEVTRLLLGSGIGNDWLGRFYMCHVTYRVDLELNRAGLVWDYEKSHDGSYCQRTLSVTEAGQRKHRLLNHRARVEHPEISDPSHASGVLSAVYLAKSIIGRQAANPLLSDQVNVLTKGVTTKKVIQPAAHVANLARDVGGVVAMSRRWVTERILSERKLPSVVLESPTNRYTLRIDAEQAPNAESRVTLGADKDAIGERRLHVAWRHTALDAESLERTAALFDAGLRRSEIGRARSVKQTLQATGGHHIGTTRMASSPTAGVVDENCRVHGIANVFVASSSVFPTSGYANPTLTILALAIRLGDHLRRYA